ncbi:hypothetical protein, partial [Clostridium sporogenes]|uniref:hypothetical protein n=1 Tax=Clostridium sporogenes TaxID=1509 RepID=UPI001A991E10
YFETGLCNLLYNYKTSFSKRGSFIVTYYFIKLIIEVITEGLDNEVAILYSSYQYDKKTFLR